MRPCFIPRAWRLGSTYNGGTNGSGYFSSFIVLVESLGISISLIIKTFYTAPTSSAPSEGCTYTYPPQPKLSVAHHIRHKRRGCRWRI